MKSRSIGMIALAGLLAACGQGARTDDEAAAAGSAAETAAPAAAAPKLVKGTGTVTAIDKTAGTVTLDHAAIPEANWPAMNMAFEAKPEMLGSLAVGDKVSFDLMVNDDAHELTAISKQ